MSCHMSFERSLRVHSEIDSVCLSVCLSVPRSSNELLDFVFILNLCCYTSLDLSQQALQTNDRLFFKFRIRFRVMGRKPKKYNE